MSRLVLILGTGRSGTSLMTKVLMSLGFDAGTNLIPGNQHNPEGFFEDRHIVETHRKLLAELDGRDLPLTPLPQNWITSSQAYAAKTSLTDYLRTNFAAGADVVIKDPRVSLLLPMWYDIAASNGLDMKLIFCGRSPAAMAESLKVAGKTPLNVGESIWLCRTIAAAESWKGGFVADFDDMVAKPKAVFGELAEWLGRKFDAAAVEGVVSEGLKHHASDLPAANPFAADVFRALRKGEAQQLLARQEDLLARYHSSLQLLNGMVDRLRAVESSKQMESIDVAYRLIDDIAKGRSDALIAEERERHRARIAAMLRDHADEIAREREERKAWEAQVALLQDDRAAEIAQAHEHLSRLTEINRRQEIDLRRTVQQLGALRAWRSGSETREQRFTQLIADLDQTRMSLGQFGQGGEATLVPTEWLRLALERLRTATVADVDRANPLALLLFGARAMKRGRSTIRRRLLHLYYLFALRSRTAARDAIAIATSGYFDPQYYGTKAVEGDPIIDFMRAGKAARNPSLLFNSKYYLNSNPTVATAHINPLVHFVRKGKTSGAKPSPIGAFGIALGSLLGNAAPPAATAGKRAKQRKRGHGAAGNGLASTGQPQADAADQIVLDTDTTDQIAPEPVEESEISLPETGPEIASELEKSSDITEHVAPEQSEVLSDASEAPPSAAGEEVAPELEQPVELDQSPSIVSR